MHNSCSPSAIYTHLISILFQRNLYLVRTPIIQRHICLNICGLWSIGNISFFHEVSPGRTNIFHWHARVLVRGQWYIFFYEICLNLRDLSWRLCEALSIFLPNRRIVAVCWIFASRIKKDNKKHPRHLRFTVPFQKWSSCLRVSYFRLSFRHAW